MPSVSTEQLERLIKEQKWDELGALLKVFFENSEEGSDKLDAIRAHIKLKTKLTEDYNKKLDSLIAEAEKGVAAGKKIDAVGKN